MVEFEDEDSRTSEGPVPEQGRKPPLAGVGDDRRTAPLHRQVAGAEAPTPTEAGRAAADRLSLEQEVTALRRTLAGKDRTLDSISLECRRLEDAIEDEHSDAEALRKEAEGLRQELERNASALSAERKAATELEREFHELRVRLLKGHRLEASSGSTYGGTPGRGGNLLPFLLGVGVGLAVAVAAGVGYLGVDRIRGTLPPLPAVGEPSASGVTGVPAGRADPPATHEPGGMAPGTAEVQPAEPPVVRTLRDHLADGSMGPLMVALPGGRFAMGSTGLGGERDDTPNVRWVSAASSSPLTKSPLPTTIDTHGPRGSGFPKTSVGGAGGGRSST